MKATTKAVTRRFDAMLSRVTQIVLVQFLLAQTACSQQAAPSPQPAAADKAIVRNQDPREQKLKTISTDLADRYRDIRDGSVHSCSWRDSLGKAEISPRNRAAEKFVGEWTAKEAALCHAMNAALGELVELAGGTSTVNLNGLYEFWYYEPTSTGGGGYFLQEPIGPFRSLEDCKSTETAVRHAGIGTKPCSNWLPLGAQLQNLLK